MRTSIRITMAGYMAVIAVNGMPALAAADEAAAPAVTRNSTATVPSGSPSCVSLTYAKDAARNPKQILTYTLVTRPGHGTVILPEPHRKMAGPVSDAIYTSATDYVGEDTFTWKVNDGAADSKIATCSIVVTAAAPSPRVQMGYVIADTQADIPAGYTGGGGYVYSVKHTDPGHGKLTLDGTTFRYTPEPHFTGVDSFTWSMAFAKDAKSVSTSTKSVTCWLIVKPAGIMDWPQWRADEWRSGFTTMNLPAALYLQWRRDFPKTASPFGGVYLDIDYCRPVQMGKTIFVPVTASDCLAAYDTDTGELRWRFYASGAVR